MVARRFVELAATNWSGIHLNAEVKLKLEQFQSLSVMESQFDGSNFHEICDQLSLIDQDLSWIIRQYGYPPMWHRANTFESLLHIILEQQVSLASALATLNRLREKILDLTPANLLSLTDEELKACYFSRQKTIYAKNLALALTEERLSLTILEKLSNEEVRTSLCKLKGIGNWTVDIYLIFVLRRNDVFPIGDLAAVNALRKIKNIAADRSTETLMKISAKWQPYRSIATMILWHYYLSSRKTLPKIL